MTHAHTHTHTHAHARTLTQRNSHTHMHTRACKYLTAYRYKPTWISPGGEFPSALEQTLNECWMTGLRRNNNNPVSNVSTLTPMPCPSRTDEGPKSRRRGFLTTWSKRDPEPGNPQHLPSPLWLRSSSGLSSVFIRSQSEAGIRPSLWNPDSDSVQTREEPVAFPFIWVIWKSQGHDGWITGHLHQVCLQFNTRA